MIFPFTRIFTITAVLSNLTPAFAMDKGDPNQLKEPETIEAQKKVIEEEKENMWKEINRLNGNYQGPKWDVLAEKFEKIVNELTELKKNSKN